MVETKLKDATFKHIEAELYTYHETKKEITRLREEILFSTKTDENSIPGRNSVREPSRTTEIIATRLTTDKRLRNLEEIITAIDRAFDCVPDEYRDVIRLKYWDRNKKDWKAIADACNMHENTALKYRKHFVYLIAEKVGWV
ncbi:MAG: transcriptional regulator [Balneolales bacterium]